MLLYFIFDLKQCTTRKTGFKPAMYNRKIEYYSDYNWRLLLQKQLDNLKMKKQLYLNTHLSCELITFNTCVAPNFLNDLFWILRSLTIVCKMRNEFLCRSYLLIMSGMYLCYGDNLQESFTRETLVSL